MPSQTRRFLFLLFFLSGFCGLLYQVVWLRMSFASFGVVTPVLSVVIAVFMLGLFAGSWLAGRLVARLTARSRLSAIWFYAGAELLIGVGALVVPYLFRFGERVLLPVGQTDSLAYLWWSALIITGAILPFCVCMGSTFPLMMAYIEEEAWEETNSFSFLYLANVIGAMAGTLVTALVLIEVLGFRRTLGCAAAANLFIAAGSAALGLRTPRRTPEWRTARAAPAARAAARPELAIGDASAGHPPVEPLAAGSASGRPGLVLFTTGFTSMAMEVVWTRAFTVVLKTQVYSFALLLFTYLLATWTGSLIYRRHLGRGPSAVVSTGRLLSALAIAAVLPVLVNDPRLTVPGLPPLATSVLRGAGALLSVFPFCALLGYLTPKIIDQGARGNPRAAGSLYAVNIAGCIVGPLVASYLMLPAIGLKTSLLALAAPYLAFHAWGLLARAPGAPGRVGGWALAGLALAGVVAARTYEDQGEGYRPGERVVRRDHTATIVSYGAGMDKKLLVNGIGITNLTTITKVMAHLPLALVGRPPVAALSICFGMGTTFRALMSWGVKVTSVELVPSVKDAFSYYFPEDARALLDRPNGRVVIDDGRRFLRRTAEIFDVITLDPPPPVEAAGSSLLYSVEFYAAVKARLAPGGILQQWIPNTHGTEVQAVVNSLLESFPYVKMYRSHEGWGHHLLASLSPIEVPAPAVLAARMPAEARADLVEWVKEKDAATFLAQVLRTEEDPVAFVRGAGPVRITDDRPFNEYYLVRKVMAALLGGGRSTSASTTGAASGALSYTP